MCYTYKYIYNAKFISENCYILKKKNGIYNVIKRLGGDILRSGGMQKEKEFIQHGNVSVYAHSVLVAALCVTIARHLRLKVNEKSLVRGALLHDYFLYDWHIPDKKRKQHAFHHAEAALTNAERDFKLDDVEKNMISAHMFPLGGTFPKYKESLILCAADKISAARETLAGRLRVKKRRRTK